MAERRGEKEPGTLNMNTEEQLAAIKECSDWFTKDKTQKSFYVDEMDELDKLYNGSHWDLLGPTGSPLRPAAMQDARPNTVENVTFAVIEGLVSEFSSEIDVVDFPVEPGDEEAARKMTQLKKFIAYKNNLDQEKQTWNRHLFLYGTAIWHVYWDPDWRGGRGPNRWVGDIRQKAIHPRNFFPDARTDEDVNTGTRVHKAIFMTLERIKERYPEYGHLVQGDALTDEGFGQNENSETYEAREDLALGVETWYIGAPLVLGEGEADEGPGLHVIWWAGEGQQIYLDHANYIYYAPGETPVFPFLVKQRYPREHNGKRSIWGYGDAHFIKPMQIALNKTRELTLEAHMHQSLGQNFYRTGALTPVQESKIKRYGSIPNMWFEVNDLGGIERKYGQGVPASLLEEPQRILKAIENVVGRFDISQGKTPGSVTAFRALDLLASRAQVRLRSADTLIKLAYQNMGRLVNELILKFYTEARAYRVLGREDDGNPQYGAFRVADIQKVYVPSANVVLPFADYSPPPDAVEGTDYEVYAPEFDTQARTSTGTPSDRMFYMETAKELYIAKVIDAETFLHVIEHGRFPPMAEVVARLQQQAQAVAQMQQEAVQEQPPSAPVPSPAPTPEEFVASLPPDIQEQVLSLPPEQQMAAIQDLMLAANDMMTGNPAG